MARKKSAKRGSPAGVPKALKRTLDIDFPNRVRMVMAHVKTPTAASFARFCDCERATIGNWLKGKPQVEALLLFQVADRCAVSPRWLLLGEGEMFDGVDPRKQTAKGDIKSSRAVKMVAVGAV